jgi:hypothetical protein
MGGSAPYYVGRWAALRGWLEENRGIMLEVLRVLLREARRRDGDAQEQLEHLWRVAHTDSAAVPLDELEALHDATRVQVEEQEELLAVELEEVPTAGTGRPPSPSRRFVPDAVDMP